MEKKPKDIERVEVNAIKRLNTTIKKNTAAVLTGEASLSLVPGSDIEAYRALCRSLWSTTSDIDRVVTITNFLAGDALVQGDQMHGEEAASIFGTSVMWTKRYCDTVIRTSQRIPPELRNSSHKWCIYVILAGSDLSNAEIKHYLGMAEDYRTRMLPNWCDITYDSLNDDKVLAMLDAVPKAERKEWKDWYDEERPNWRTMAKELEKGAIPANKPTMTEMIVKIIDDEDAVPNHPAVRQGVVECMWRLLDEVKAGNIKKG